MVSLHSQKWKVSRGTSVLLQTIPVSFLPTITGLSANASKIPSCRGEEYGRMGIGVGKWQAALMGESMTWCEVWRFGNQV